MGFRAVYLSEGLKHRDNISPKRRYTNNEYSLQWR